LRVHAEKVEKAPAGGQRYKNLCAIVDRACVARGVEDGRSGTACRAPTGVNW
jgi:hypothetical protein